MTQSLTTTAPRVLLLIGSLFVVGSLAHLDAGEVTDAADADAVAAIEKLGGSVREIAANSEDRNVEFHLGGRELTDDGLALVAALKNVVALNLKNTQITSAGLVHLKGLTKLRRLHLEKTAVDDDGLVHLAGLTNLEYLNLYGTKISNKSLSQITSLKKLRRLYVWQTDVTDEGVAQLAKALPELKVVQGVDLSKLPPPPPVKPPTPIKWIAAGGPQPPRSKNGSSTEVVFQNKSDRKVKIVWVGYDGNLRHYHDLNPGETKRQNTYADNTWVITDENDKPLGHFIVGSDVALAVIPK